MSRLLPAPVCGVIMTVLLVLNTLFWAAPIYVCIAGKLITPVGSRVRRALSHIAATMAQNWALCNTFFVDLMLPTKWVIRIDADVHQDGQYLVCSNHQSWNDIVVLMKAFGRRAPFFKFFIKQQLIWVPVIGLVWWGLDYPFMKRYTPTQLKKNPKLKGKDLDTTRRACERFRDQPGMLLNFLEGTRFTQAKRLAQGAPYQNLLRPKSGGFAFALSALGGSLNSLLDVTIVYPQGPDGLWAFLTGGVREVIVEVRQLTVPQEFFTGYEKDPDVRKRFQRWLGDIWQKKDARISELLGTSAVTPTS